MEELCKDSKEGLSASKNTAELGFKSPEDLGLNAVRKCNFGELSPLKAASRFTTRKDCGTCSGKTHLVSKQTLDKEVLVS